MKKEVKPDNLGYIVYIVHPDRVATEIGGEAMILSRGDLILIPTNPRRVLYEVYNHTRASPTCLKQGSLKGLARQIILCIRDDRLEDTDKYSKLVIADKILGVKELSVASFVTYAKERL